MTRITFLDGDLLREGDVLEGEVTGPAEAQAAAELLADHLPSSRARSTQVRRTLALFDLSPRSIERHGKDGLDKVFSSVH